MALDEVKERILEYSGSTAARQKIARLGVVFGGSAGVGKTSLGESIARATNRKVCADGAGWCA
jgi:ATP-dependent Lon protease